ncbi:MAG: hypothetical protein OEX22_08285 [Cyclobacteriaceae bacterium]|nr:hypothetical protein [Cyclobacteriaceae bacterium]
MKLKNISGIFLVLTLFSCSCNDNTVEPLPLIFSTDYYTNYGGDYEVWVVISDEEGNLISYQRVEGDSVLNFYGDTKSKSISLTGIRILGSKINIQTYQELYETGSSLFQEIDIPNALRSEIIGQAHLVIENYSDAADPNSVSTFQISSNYNEGGPLDQASEFISGYTYSCDLNLAFDSVHLLITTYFEGYPMYHEFGIKTGDTVIIDFNQFKQMNYFQLEGNFDFFSSYSSLPFNSYSNAGFHSFSESIQRDNSISSRNKSEVLIGYLNGYDRYRFTAALNHSSLIYNYIPNEKVNLEYFAESLDYNGNTIEDFTCRINREFNFKYISFGYEDPSSGASCNWLYLTDQENQKPIELPSEVLREFNSLKIDINALEIERVQIDFEETEGKDISFVRCFDCE